MKQKDEDRTIYFTIQNGKESEKANATRQEWEREWLEWWKRVRNFRESEE